MKIGIIGLGNMAKSIVRGWVESGIDPASIYVTNRTVNSAVKFANDYGVNAVEPKELVAKVDYVFLCMKPKDLPNAVSSILDYLTEKHILVSIAAGVSVKTLNELVNHKCHVIRVMPNTPAMVNEGMTMICKDMSCELEVNVVNKLFARIGESVILDEKDIHAFIALAGSSPAYGYMLIDAMADAGVKLGIKKDIAIRMAAQAIMGTSKMVLETGMHPVSLKDQVCSPGGTTIEAVTALKENGFDHAVIDAMVKCANKSMSMEKK